MKKLVESAVRKLFRELDKWPNEDWDKIDKCAEEVKRLLAAKKKGGRHAKM